MSPGKGRVKKKRGVKGKMSDADKADSFGNHKDGFYNLTEQKMHPLAGMSREFFFTDVVNRFKMNDLAVWVAAYRYGEEMKYIDKKPSQIVRMDDEDDKKDPNFVREDITAVIDPDNVWIIPTDRYEHLKITSTQEKYVSGLRMLLREVAWYCFRFPCNFEFTQVGTSSAEMYAKLHCRLCSSIVEFETIANRSKLQVSSKGVDAE